MEIVCVSSSNRDDETGPEEWALFFLLTHTLFWIQLDMGYFCFENRAFCVIIIDKNA